MFPELHEKPVTVKEVIIDGNTSREDPEKIRERA